MNTVEGVFLQLRRSVLLLYFLLMSLPGGACSIDMVPGQILTPAHVLIREADVIVVARAIGYVPEKKAGPIGAVPSDRLPVIDFEPIRVLKGSVDRSLRFAGGFKAELSKSRADEIPYNHVGRTGPASCYALDYGEGYLYLFMLKNRQGKDYTPYWSVLSPTNEYVKGVDDPWVKWVAAEIERQNRGTIKPANAAVLENRIKADIEEIRIGRVMWVSRDLEMITPQSIPYLIGNMDDPRPLVPPAPLYDSSGYKIEAGQIAINGIEIPTKEGTVGEALCWLLRHRLLIGSKEHTPESWCKFANRIFEPNERSPVDEWRAWCVDRYPESKDICLGSRSAFMREKPNQPKNK